MRNTKLLAAAILSVVLLLAWRPELPAQVVAAAYNLIQDEGSNLARRRTLNFEGAGVSCADDAGNSRTNCTIPGGGGGGSGVANYDQSFVAQTSVVLAHNLNTTAVLVNCYTADTPPVALIPNNIEITDADNVTVTFEVSQSGTCVVNGSLSFLEGTSASIGGGALLAGACDTDAFTVTGATVGMVVAATPETYPGDGNFWWGYVSMADEVTVGICAAVAGTPTASIYNVRVF